MNADQIKALRDWARHSGGLSSYTLISALVPELADFCDGAARGLGSTPADPSDFKRCLTALSFIPNGREHLSKVADLYPRWRQLVDAWAELEALYWSEAPSGMAPLTFNRMLELNGEKPLRPGVTSRITMRRR
jgi:hypothetical protein